MALSEDAKGIINEIRSQANTTRHKSENYSLKAIRADLGKFQEIFTAMQASFAGLDANAVVQAEQARRAAELAQLSEAERNKILKDEANRTKRENVLKNKELALREKELKKRQRSDFKIFGKDGIIGSLFSGTFNILKQALFVGVGGSILYELTAGFLERFGIELPPIADVAAKFGNLAKSTNWKELQANLNALAGKDVAAALGTLALGVGATKVLPMAGEALQTFSIIKILEKLMTPDLGDIDEAGNARLTAGRTAMGAVRLGIAGLLFYGLTSAMPAMEDVVRKYALGMSEDDIANRKVDAVDIGGNAVSSLAGLFVPGGPLVKLAAVVGLFAFKTLTDYLEQAADRDETSNAAKDVMAEVKAGDEKLQKLLKVRKNALKYGLDTKAIDEEIEALQAEIEGATREGLQKAATEGVEKQERLRKEFLDYKEKGLDQIPTFTYDTEGYGNNIRTVRRDLTESERVAMFTNMLQSKEDKYLASKAQLNRTMSLASELGISPDDLGVGLVQTVDGIRTVTKEQIDAVERQVESTEALVDILQGKGGNDNIISMLRTVLETGPTAISPPSIIINSPDNSSTIVKQGDQEIVNAPTSRTEFNGTGPLSSFGVSSANPLAVQ